MKVFHSKSKLNQYFKEKGIKNSDKGFIPTMGALHHGHISLIAESKSQSKLTICSIFVNPTQFNNKSDLEKYPVSLNEDIDLLEEAECDILYAPDVNDVYPDGTRMKADVKFDYLGEILEAEKRPGHFEGVAQVVGKLLDIIKPGKIFMGQKDYQQAMIVQKLIDQLYPQVELVVCPIIREKHGLAMSSRNRRLSDEGKKNALALSNSLYELKKAYGMTGFNEVYKGIMKELKENPEVELEYIEIRSRQLNEVHMNDLPEQAVALIAAWVEGVRLIDNVLLSFEKQ